MATKTRHVVTAFLENAGRILVLRRSEAVSTYQGRWAGVSGGVHEEESPLAQALREIEEETGLAGGDVALVADGDPEVLEAPELGTRWVIHPFLFHTATPSKVRLDWEHTELRWVAPDEIARLETVPRLVEVLERVDPRRYSDAARVRARERVRQDRERGATALAADAWRHLLRLVAYGAHDDAAALERDLGREVATVAASRPTLVAVEAAALAFAAWFADRVAAGRVPAERGGEGGDLAALRADVWRLDDARRASLDGVAQRVAAALGAWLPEGGRVATLSHSGVVRDALLALRDRLGGVVVLESRPRSEGRTLAARLAAAGVAVTLLPDAAVVAAATRTDLSLVGADAIAPDGGVVNKIGSHALALAARAAGRPFLVATTTDRVDPAAPREAEQQPPDELWADPPVGVAVENAPFEAVPAALVTALLTEEGPLPEARLRALAARARDLRARFLR